MPDIVDDVLQRLRALAPDIPPQVTQQLEVQSREVWGGSRCYVALRPTVHRTAKMAEALRAQRPLREVFAEAGIGKAYGYRLLQRK